MKIVIIRNRAKIIIGIFILFVVSVTFFPNSALGNTKTRMDELVIDLDNTVTGLSFKEDFKAGVAWSNNMFPNIPDNLSKSDDLQIINNINNELRRKYMNRSELYYDNPTLDMLDNLFITALTHDIKLYVNYSSEDFGIDISHFNDDIDNLYASMLENSEYGIDHGYLSGSLTPLPFEKDNNEVIQLEISVPAGTKIVRIGSLSSSQFMLERNQVIQYKTKQIIQDSSLQSKIKIEAELVPASLLQLEINNYNDSLNNLLLEEFNIDYSLVNLEPVGLNAGFVLSSGEEVAKKSLTSLKTRNLIETNNVKDWEVFFTNRSWVHTEIFEKETEGMTIEQKREHFDHYYNSDSSGSTLKLENGIGRTSVNFKMLSKGNELQENILIEHISSIMLHEYFHFLIHNNNNFKERPMFKEDTFESEINGLKMSEEDILIDILNDGYASTKWEEFICEAFRAMLHPHKPIAQRFEQEMIGTQRFLTNLFDIYPPTVPKNLQELEVGGNYVKFTFDHSTDNISVQKYNIYRNDKCVESYDTDMDENGYHSPNPAEDGQERIEVEIKDLNQVTEYEFRVSAVDEAQNESEKSEPLKIKTKDTEPPELSGNLRKRVLASSLVHLNLPEATDNVGVTRTKIRRVETSSLFNFSYLSGTEVIFELDGNIRHFSDVSIQRGKRYTYSMTALDEAGNESKPSNEVIVETSEEDDRKRNRDRAKDTTSTNSTLDWNGSFSGISPSGFQIFGWVQGLTGWAFTGITTVGSSLSSVAVGLTPGLSHLFLVLPIDGNGNPMDEGLDISVDALPHSVIDLRITNVQHTRISLNWESVNDQSSLPGTLYHDIYRNNEKIATIDGQSTSYTDHGLTPSTKYEYYVIARIGDTPSEKSNTATGTTLEVYDDTMVRFESILFPSEVITHSQQLNEQITVAEFNNKSTQFIHLMFDESRNAYQLFNKETGAVFGIDPDDNTTIIMQDNMAQDDQFWYLNQIENTTFELENYKYNNKVLVVDENRTTQLSDKTESSKAQQFNLLIDNEPPTAPKDLTYLDLTDSSVRLKWSPSEDNVGVSGYLVYNESHLIGQVDGKTTEYTVSDLLSYTDYLFSVVAIDHSGNQSESSDILELKTKPKAPTNLSAKDLTQTSFTLYWENSEAAEAITGYEIYQDETLIRTVDKNTLSLFVENLDTAMYYTFTVKAKTAVNSSLASEKLTIKTHSLPLSEIVKGYSLTDNEIIITLDRASYEGHNRIVLLNEGGYVGETYNNRFFYARLVNSTEDTVDIRFETNTTTNDLTLEIRSGQPGGQQYDVLETLSILPLSPPKNLSYDEIDDSSVKLSWEPGDNHSSETGFEIYQDEKYIQTVPASENTFVVDNLQSATDYKFTVKARVGSQISQPSNKVEFTTLPKAPSNLQANNITDSSALLSWEAGEYSDIVTGYEIYKDGQLLQTVDKDTLVYKAEDLISATSYIFTVSTKVKSGVSLPSNRLDLITRPKAPINLKVHEDTENSVDLTWESGERPDAITGYGIYKNDQLLELVDQNTLTYRVENLEVNTTYRFTVRTLSGSDNVSESSNEVEWSTKLIEGVWGDVPWSFSERTQTIILYGGNAGMSAAAPWRTHTTVENIVVKDTVVLQPSAIRLFSDLRSLKAIENASNLDTSNVTSMENMFAWSSRLEKIDVSDWDTSSVTSMNSMFHSARNIKDLDVSKWDTSNVRDMSFLFYFTQISNLDVSKWDTSNVANMMWMFSNTHLTNLDLSNFNTSNVTNMSRMFATNPRLRYIDLSSFDTSNVISMSSMLRDSRNIDSIRLGSHSIFNADVELPAITITEKYTGRWKLQSVTEDDSSNVIYSSSNDFMINYDGSNPGLYSWESTLDEGL